MDEAGNARLPAEEVMVTWCRKYVIPVATVVVAAACSSGDGLVVLVPTAIEVSQSTLSFESLGEDKQLSARVTDQNGNPLQAIVSWASANTGVATVSGGKVTAAGPGTTSVIATAGAINKSIAIS